MSKFDKIAVLKKIGDTGMVPVFYNKDLEVCKNVVKACYEGGVRAFEFTNRGDFAHEIFGELVKWADKECPELALGIGSVVDAPTNHALRFSASGATPPVTMISDQGIGAFKPFTKLGPRTSPGNTLQRSQPIS